MDERKITKKWIPWIGICRSVRKNRLNKQIQLLIGLFHPWIYTSPPRQWFMNNWYLHLLLSLIAAPCSASGKAERKIKAPRLTFTYCTLSCSGVGPRKKWKSRMPPMVRRVTAGVLSSNRKVEYSVVVEEGLWGEEEYAKCTTLKHQDESIKLCLYQDIKKARMENSSHYPLRWSYRAGLSESCLGHPPSPCSKDDDHTRSWDPVRERKIMI